MIAAKGGVRATMDLGCAGGLEEGKRLHEVVYASNDAIEGPRAFAEKRAPVWTGTMMEIGMTDLIRLDRDGPVGILRFLQPAKLSTLTASGSSKNW